MVYHHNYPESQHGHPTEEQFETIKKDIVKRKEDVIKEDGYGNVLPKTNDPDRFVDEIGDA